MENEKKNLVTFERTDKSFVESKWGFKIEIPEQILLQFN